MHVSCNFDFFFFKNRDFKFSYYRNSWFAFFLLKIFTSVHSHFNTSQYIDMKSSLSKNLKSFCMKLEPKAVLEVILLLLICVWSQSLCSMMLIMLAKNAKKSLLLVQFTNILFYVHEIFIFHLSRPSDPFKRAKMRVSCPFLPTNLTVFI